MRTAAGLVEFEGSYYYAEFDGKLATSSSVWVGNTNGLLTAGTYRIDAEGKLIMTTEIVNENGTLYYYQDGRRINGAGLVKIGEDYYFIESGAIAATNKTTWVYKLNGHPFAEGNYRFDAEGKMILTTDVVDEGGTLYYYKDGRRTAGAGLVLVNGDYYYIDSAAKAVTSTTVKVDKTNNLLSKGTYYFGADGKLIQ